MSWGLLSFHIPCGVLSKFSTKQTWKMEGGVIRRRRQQMCVKKVLTSFLPSHDPKCIVGQVAGIHVLYLLT
ncbi:hypothetical protein EI94DRAFT_1078843 [Lactarius quietus]|nr:hypothetical protein EI94DRAFT_1078843 [Lactarius quietus]